MISFDNVEWFWLFIPTLVLSAVIGWRYIQFGNLLKSVFNEQSSHMMGVEQSRKHSTNRLILLFVGTVLFIFALAGPQMPGGEVEVEQEGSDVIIALDISQSMLVRDVPPNRLQQSVKFITEFTRSIEGERLGLIFFAGSAYRQMPLSTDLRLAHIFLRNADPGQISNQGTSIGDAIDLAIEMFELKKDRGKLLIIISDGEDHDPNSLRLAEKAHNEGIYILTAGIGTLEGGPVPEYFLGREQFIRNQEDQVVISQFNPLTLQRIAEVGQGRYFNLSNPEEAAQNMNDIVDKIKKGVLSVQNINAFKPLYQYPLALGCICYILFMIWPVKRHK